MMAGDIDATGPPVRDEEGTFGAGNYSVERCDAPSGGVDVSTSAQKQSIQLTHRELAPGGATMVALVGAFGGLHLAQ